MEGRMTVCNMAIEGGARAGLIAPDETTFEYCKGRPNAPSGDTVGGRAGNYWKTLYTDDDARFDKVLTLKGEDIAPVVTWGTSPRTCLPITGSVPRPEIFTGGKVEAAKRALEYMGLTAGRHPRHSDRHSLHRLLHQRADRGSARGGRNPEGRKIKDGMRAMIVPGSGLGACAGRRRRLADIFKEAGFEWRLAGCSMCLAMNPDQSGTGRALRGHLKPQL